MAVAAFMATTLGRLIRVVAGIVLLGVGLALCGGTTGWIAVASGVLLAAIGALLIALGAFNVCLIAVLLGAPFSGRQVLERQKRPTS